MVWKGQENSRKSNNIEGIYFSSFPEYSLRYCKDEMCLVLCYVIMSNPYPIIHDDAPSQSTLVHYGKGNYKNYGSHYVPVIPYGGLDFRPPPLGIVVTQVVTLQANRVNSMKS